jgi:hypothetical protein
MYSRRSAAIYLESSETISFFYSFFVGNSQITLSIPKPSSMNNYHDPADTKSGNCLKNYFEDILLIIIYHFPFYDSISLLESFYNEAFTNIVICGPKSNSQQHIMVVDLHRGYYGYECVGEAIRRYENFEQNAL